MKAIWWGGFLCGVLDISAAFVTWGVRGIGPARILRSVARGVLGPSATQGGFGTAVLGLFLHFTIAFIWAAIYWAASRGMRVLARRWVPFGMLYGIVVFAVMNWVVLPLSAVGRAPTLNTQALVIAVLTHMFCVGLPIAWATRKFQ